MRLVRENIRNPLLCGAIKRDGTTIAVGLCVVERGYAGLLGIVVDSAYRHQGYGYNLCASLLGQARKLGAVKGYLQVLQNNDNAIRLYEKLGFHRLYEYRYRVKELEG
jgi:ribosomal protein S18 acetylase RimI-like enzyme